MNMKRYLLAVTGCWKPLIQYFYIAKKCSLEGLKVLPNIQWWAELLQLVYLVSETYSHTVQSRSLQNLQASRVLHVTDPPVSAEDEAESLHHHFPRDRELDDITARMEKLAVNQDQPSLEPVSRNSSQDERMGHFHIDPITGHIATLTLDPHRSARMRPHADDMWKKKKEEEDGRRRNHHHMIFFWTILLKLQQGNIWGCCLHSGKLGFNHYIYIYIVVLLVSLYAFSFHLIVFCLPDGFKSYPKFACRDNLLTPSFDKMLISVLKTNWLNTALIMCTVLIQIDNL